MAMTLAYRTHNERVIEPSPQVLAYAKAGLVSAEPDSRADYTDTYVLRAPAMLLGHELIELEDEHFEEYLGCCVSPGLGATLKIVGDTTELRSFAAENKCKLTVIGQRRDAPPPGAGQMPPGARVRMSCRERDAEPWE